MSFLKKDATPEIVAAVQSIEDRADECYKPLTILQLPANDAIWALLAGGAKTPLTYPLPSRTSVALSR